jgi:anti-sigma regulatory factor (Ser/Thr protein kinase)
MAKTPQPHFTNMADVSGSRLEIEFSGNSSELARVRTSLRSFLSGVMEEIHLEAVVLAIDEACANIIRHALSDDSKPVKLTCILADSRLSVVLRDYGKPCNPALIKGRDLDEIQPGGLGVHIITHVFDRVEYAPQSEGTRLTLEKSIAP